MMYILHYKILKLFTGRHYFPTNKKIQILLQEFKLKKKCG